MNIGIRLHDTTPAPFVERIENAHKDGFQCIQLAPRFAVTDIPVAPYNMTPGLGSFFKKTLDKNEIDVAILGCYLNWGHPDPQAIKEMHAFTTAHLQFAKYIGAYMVGTETGAVNADYRYEPANHTEEALQTFIKNYTPVVRCAEKLGVMVGIEPVIFHIVSDMKRAMRVIDAIDSPNLQLIFDPVNLINLDNYQDEEKIIREAIEIAGHKVGAIHLKDYLVKDGVYTQVAAGKGQFKYDYLMQWVKEQKPHIHIILESTTPENALEIKAFTESFFR